MKGTYVLGLVLISVSAILVMAYTNATTVNEDGLTDVLGAYRNEEISIKLSDYDYDKITVELPGHVWGEPKDIVNNTITIKISEYDKVVIISYLKLSGDRYTTIAMELIEIQ